jgi:DNA-binding CsgD family transcriptional regulator
VTRSLELAEQLRDPALCSRALAALALFRRSIGGGDALEHAQHAVALAEESGDRSALDETQHALGDVLFWTGRLDEARSVLEQLLDAVRERDERWLSSAHWYLSLVELWDGNWNEAARHAECCREIAALYAPEEVDATALYPAAMVAAHRDDAAVARRLARLGLAHAETDRHLSFAVNHQAVLGMVDFREGEALQAVEQFDAAEKRRRTLELLVEPNMRFYFGDYIEALLELGRIDEAVAVLEPWASEAERLGRGWALAHATRCRGLAAAAIGEMREALETLEEALALSSGAGPFGTARAALALGVVRRRARQKRTAREALEQAISGFDSLGARSWSERAASELARVGGRVPAGTELTPAEQRVAKLVAEGRTNREVAASLFVAERTVEGHLSHIYAKLGLRSRTELARRLS